MFLWDAWSLHTLPFLAEWRSRGAPTAPHGAPTLPRGAPTPPRGAPTPPCGAPTSPRIQDCFQGIAERCVPSRTSVLASSGPRNSSVRMTPSQVFLSALSLHRKEQEQIPEICEDTSSVFPAVCVCQEECWRLWLQPITHSAGREGAEDRTRGGLLLHHQSQFTDIIQNKLTPVELLRWRDSSERGPFRGPWWQGLLCISGTHWSKLVQSFK